MNKNKIAELKKEFDNYNSMSDYHELLKCLDYKIIYYDH